MDNYIIYPKQLRRQNIPIEKNRCFFLMPFSHEFDIVYGTIKKVLNDSCFVCNRADEISGSTPIIAKILTEIMKAQYIIVDITNSNPNVYYELGISHTLKEARNVLLIKRRDYETPFDISHLTYIEYDVSNLMLLGSTILNFLFDCQRKNVLYDALSVKNIIGYIDENNNDCVEYLQNEAPDIITSISKALMGEAKELTNGEINEIISSFKKLFKNIVIYKNNKLLPQFLDVFFETIASIPEQEITRSFVAAILDDYFHIFHISEANVNEYKTRLALSLVKNETYLDIAIPWIINYFSRSKSTTIDLNRYKIENLLMTSSLRSIDEAIINSLCNSDCYIREHMSDIIGEKKLIDAAPLLYAQLAREKNFFTAQSMIEAIGKLKQSGGITAITKWIDENKEEIINTKQLFVLKHAYIAIASLDETRDHRHINKFNYEFKALLENYFIV